MLYQAFKSYLLECRRAFLLGLMTTEEADTAFNNLIKQLKTEHEPARVDEAYELFELDLKIFDRIQTLYRFGWVGIVIIQIIVWWYPSQQVTRVALLEEDLLTLEEEFPEDI